MLLEGSPPGFSIFITSAPKSPSILPQRNPFSSVKSKARYGASIKVAEIPPGPPVLSTLVAEVYGPDPLRQIEISFHL